MRPQVFMKRHQGVRSSATQCKQPIQDFPVRKRRQTAEKERISAWIHLAGCSRARVTAPSGSIETGNLRDCKSWPTSSGVALYSGSLALATHVVVMQVNSELTVTVLTVNWCMSVMLCNRMRSTIHVPNTWAIEPFRLGLQST